MFKTDAPTTPAEWISAGFEITPCIDKKPITKDWGNVISTAKDFKPNHQIGLKLKGLVDFDIDNHYIKRFVEKYLKSRGAVYGRKSNPLSHFLFNNSLASFKYFLPKELEKYCKDFPHGVTLCEIRCFKDSAHQSIVPGSIVENETVEWSKYASINEYNGDLAHDIGKIALSGALSILYPSKGNRDNYCTSIAGVLSQHTEWSAGEIDEFVYNLAVFSNDENAKNKMSKGTNAKNSKGNKLGIPTIAEIVGCTNGTIGKLFSWIGVKDSGSLFTDLKCYMTIPKYWELKYKDHVLRIMDTAILMSYSKMQVIIEENCFETAPPVTPKEWRQIRAELYKNVQKVDVPYEQSFFGVIANHFSDFCELNFNMDKEHLFDRIARGCWHDQANKRYVFKLESFTDRLRGRRVSFEQRTLTAMLREKFGAETMKITLNKKELRVWTVPMANVEKFENATTGTFVDYQMEHLKKKLGTTPDDNIKWKPDNVF